MNKFDTRELKVKKSMGQRSGTALYIATIKNLFDLKTEV